MAESNEAEEVDEAVETDRPQLIGLGQIGEDEIRLVREQQPLTEPAGSSVATFLLALRRRGANDPALIEAIEYCLKECVDRENVASLLDWYLVVTDGRQPTGDCYSLPIWIPEPLLTAMGELRGLEAADRAPLEVLEAVRLRRSAETAMTNALELSDTGTNKFAGEHAAWESVRAKYDGWLEQLARGIHSELPKVNCRRIMKDKDMQPGSDRWRRFERRFNSLESAAGELADATLALPAHGSLPGTERHLIDVWKLSDTARALFVCCVESLLDEEPTGTWLEEIGQDCARIVDGLSSSLSEKDRVWLAMITRNAGLDNPALASYWEKIEDIRTRIRSLRDVGRDVDFIEYHLDAGNDVDAALAAADEVEAELVLNRRRDRLDRQFEELKARVIAEAPGDEALAGQLQLIEADLSDSQFDSAEDGISDLRSTLEESRRESRISELRDLLARIDGIKEARVLRDDLEDALGNPEGRLERATQLLVDKFADRVEQVETSYREAIAADLADTEVRLKQVSDGLTEAERQSLEDLLADARRSLEAEHLAKARESIESASASINRRHMPVWLPEQGEVALVDHIEKYLAQRGRFDPLDVRRLHASFKTRRFVILAGLTGSGKSTIARGYAEALGATGDRFRRVAVRPNWVDESEALGYVNPTSRRFEPGWLATLVKNCGRDPELPHFLVLDEMNLAPVEYYLADVLSAIEDVTAPGNRPTLQLYPPDAAPTNGKEWPDQLEFPRNLFIVGTVNIDESTRAISDRVLDRANVIQLSLEIDRSHHEPAAASHAEPPWRVRMSSWDQLLSHEADDRGHELLVDIGKVLADIRIGVGTRSHIEVERFVSNSHGLLEPAEALDFAILQRIIPKIRGFRDEIDGALDEIRKLVSEAELSHCEAVFDYWLEDRAGGSTFIDGTDATVGLAGR